MFPLAALRCHQRIEPKSCQKFHVVRCGRGDNGRALSAAELLQINSSMQLPLPPQLQKREQKKNKKRQRPPRATAAFILSSVVVSPVAVAYVAAVSATTPTITAIDIVAASDGVAITTKSAVYAAADVAFADGSSLQKLLLPMLLLLLLLMLSLQLRKQVLLAASCVAGVAAVNITNSPITIAADVDSAFAGADAAFVATALTP